jgi:hypothetical protein
MSSWTCISGSWREPLLFESFLQVGQLSLLKEVEEFLAAALPPGHGSESQAGSGSPTPLTVSDK